MYNIDDVTKEPGEFLNGISKQLEKDMGGQEDDHQ